MTCFHLKIHNSSCQKAVRQLTPVTAQLVVQLIELKSCVSLSLKILECRDKVTCPKETVNEFGICWGLGKGIDNSPMIEKGANFSFPL